MPERFTPCSGADEVNGVKLLPRRFTLSRCDPGQAPDIDRRGRAPFVMRGGGQADESTGNPVSGDVVFGVQLTKQLDAPVEQAIGIVDAELQPIETVGITGERPGRLDVFP